METLNREQLEEWYNEGKAENYDYMLIVCDTWDYGLYPIYCNYDNWDKNRCKYEKDMQTVKESYSLTISLEDQITPRRVWNTPHNAT